uniref:SFRICE_012354 n=1 Tax=Spodoptera frugiperda TaxID=7108 RepID=A0A2H1VHR7_SPOFR
MRAVFALVALGLTVVTAVPANITGIVGGSETVISRYSSIVGLLYSSDGNNFNQVCVGAIVNMSGDAVYKWRARAGSSWANWGGFMYSFKSFTIHPNFNFRTMNNDIAILHPTTDIAYTIGNVVKPASIAGPKYNLPVNDIVWAAGWGSSVVICDGKQVGAAPEEKLRHIEGWIISEHTCSSKYAAVGANVTGDMLCFGWPYGVSRNRCQGDSGSPVYHHSTLVGISSRGYGCDIPGYPGVNTQPDPCVRAPQVAITPSQLRPSGAADYQAAVPTGGQRIVGGSLTTIDQYPTIAAILFSFDWVNYTQSCGGIIINNRSILTAAHCTDNRAPGQFRIRVGSSFRSSGGVVHNVMLNIVHPAYNPWTMDSDIAILRSASTFSFNNNVRAASIAGANYFPGDNQAVWAAGWGDTYSSSGAGSEQLRHVQLVVINQETCRRQYENTFYPITDNMLCAGWPTGGRDTCQCDSGGPLYHNGVVVGVTSYGMGCADVRYAGVSAHYNIRILALVALCFATVAAVPTGLQRIVGGSLTTIDQYPSIVALLCSSWFNNYQQCCGSIIINNRSVLTAAHCTENEPASKFRIRVGSSFRSSGGVVHNVILNIIHPAYNSSTLDSDIAILRSATTFSFNNNVRAASIAGANYYPGDNQAVWAAGWGDTYSSSGAGSEQLRHVQLVVINQETCRHQYENTFYPITDNMLCAGWPTGGRDTCQRDSGGPLYHNGVVVGVTSYGMGCADVRYAGVSAPQARHNLPYRCNSCKPGSTVDTTMKTPEH